MKNQILLVVFVFLFCGCGSNDRPKEVLSYDTVVKNDVPATQAVVGLSQQDSIKAIGRQVLVFLKDQNYNELVKYFSGEGIFFSPYGNIDTLKCKKLTPNDFLESIEKRWILTWGTFDGTGEPIKLTLANYLKKFVYNADYLNAEAEGFDKVIKEGNSLNNIVTTFPNHHFIDYHFSGFQQENNGMDWTSLRLVFKKIDTEYFLVAVVHDQWTI